jgi:hypothetical protein
MQIGKIVYQDIGYFLFIMVISDCDSYQFLNFKLYYFIPAKHVNRLSIINKNNG